MKNSQPHGAHSSRSGGFTVARHLIWLLLVLPLCGGCSVKTFAINKVGDALSSGDSVYESDDDIELVGSALPFGLKLTESLLSQSPDHPGLLLTACRGFVLYSYAYVDFAAQVERDRDLDHARELRSRARRLYLRGLRNGLHALETSYPGFQQRLRTDPKAALAPVGKDKARDVAFLYWSAAALGLAISASRDDAGLLARLPEVEAMLDRALELDEAWDAGALHEFKVIFAGGGQTDGRYDGLTAHYKRALALSKGRRPGLYVAYAEAWALPTQNKEEFRLLLQKAVAIDPDEQPTERLATLLTQRRARWLLGRIDEMFDAVMVNQRGGGR